MNTLLIIFTLYNSTLVPELAINYPTEQQCIARVNDYSALGHHRRGVCVSPRDVKNLRSINDETGSYWLTKEQIKGLGLEEEELGRAW